MIFSNMVSVIASTVALTMSIKLIVEGGRPGMCRIIFITHKLQITMGEFYGIMMRILWYHDIHTY